MTFVVVGGGPTGVELAGALGEIARDTLRRDFRSIDPADARIILVEAMDRVLPTYPPDRSASARRQLERLGVTVRTGTRVTDIDERAVRVVATPGGRRRARGGHPGPHGAVGAPACIASSFARVAWPRRPAPRRTATAGSSSSPT